MMYGARKWSVIVGAAFALEVSCNGSSSSDTTVDASAADAGDSGRPAVDAADSDHDNGPYGESCQFPVTMQDIVEVNPPKANTQGSCTDAELVMVKGKFADILKAVSPTCASCLFTEANDMTNTQFFVWADTMHVNVSVQNYGACMGSPLSGGNADCGKAAEELDSCLQAACPVDAQGSSLCSTITEQECIDYTLQHDCKPYDQKQTDACGGVVSLQAIRGKCFDNPGDPGDPNSLNIDPGTKLLCGGAAADAGSDAGDGGGD